MKRSWILVLLSLAGLSWAARQPSEPWGADLDLALAEGRAVVVLVALPGRPQGEAARSALDHAWRTLRPRAARVALTRCTPRLGRESALAVCVFDPGGQLVARRDGPIDASIAEDWLREALDAASSAASRARAACSSLQARFEHAELALRLGAIDCAQREFTLLAGSADPGLCASANERLARLEFERGDVARARELSALAGASSPNSPGRLLLTRGMIEFAERENRAACATLREARLALAEVNDLEADRAALELARAQAACGETSGALATLDELARSSASHSMRQSARELSNDLCVPPVSH